jgi:dolichyl-phosphate beta-glucosyltransferase
MNISIIIPAFNESKKIERDIIAAAECIEKNDFQGEIIIVDDGSSDSTADVVQSVEVSAKISLHIIRYVPHRGKGYAVRTGMKSAQGEYILYADSGLCIPYDNVLTGLQILKSGDFDCAHASRKLPESTIVKQQPLNRRLISRIFRWIFTHWLHIPAELTDTQCGFKVYKGDTARNVYAQCSTDGFLFEIEIILRSLKQGYRIKEFPVEWTADPDSRLSAAKNSFGVFRELIAIKRLLSNL